MTRSLCQRRCRADRTIRLFCGGRRRAREIDANPLDPRERTRGACRQGPPIRQLLLWECHYDDGRVALPLAERLAERLAVRRLPAAPQIVLHAPGNTRRFCLLSGAERCANDFLP
ncbi:hypothetical protein [Burkholderia vietnamiensis]|uniref:hypothetical protein n=1 Tax=Burkholderia vietnamiensis TaxID=60552 RepID=UPI0012DB3C70|nr:hypothetical protein [Burkholderia vietnamiensis]